MAKVEQIRFHRTPFPCMELDYVSDEAVRRELYDRLNFGGTPHGDADRLQVSANCNQAENDMIWPDTVSATPGIIGTCASPLEGQYAY